MIGHGLLDVCVMALLLATLTNARAAEQDVALPGGGSVRMVYVSAGAFVMGNDGREAYVYPDETPGHEVFLSGYWIGKFEVTRGQYRRFIDAGGYSEPKWWSKEGWAWKSSRKQPGMWEEKQIWLPPLEFTQTEDYPVTGVSYHEAEAFCNWAGLQLPTEAQWEKAARWDGKRSRVYPWGDKWEPERCNNWYDKRYEGFQSAPVGSYQSGASPCGCLDMAGNSWEWCRDWYSPSYYRKAPKDGWVDPEGPSTGTCRSMRGGSWFGFDYNTRCSYRGGYFYPGNWYYEYGFRVVVGAKDSDHGVALRATGPSSESFAPTGTARSVVTTRPRPTRAKGKGIEAYTGTDPIGGGKGYSRILSRGDFTASNAEELKAALAKAQPGQVVYIADGAEIDLTAEKPGVTVPGGVTLAGNRGQNGSAGPVIFCSDLDRYPMLQTGGPGVRVTGIRIRGADTEIRRTGDDKMYNSLGFQVSHPNAEFDNCEVLGWSAAGVHFGDAGAGGSMHHCYVHHNRRAGNGYGVYVHASQVDIEANHFAENRHDIAGSGRAGSSYTARYNLSEGNEPFTSHAFDMHGNQDSRAPGEVVPNIAGDRIVICDNTFRSCRPRIYIAIRGKPRYVLTIHDNVYENAYIGAMLSPPCSNAVVYGDHFSVPAKRGRYSLGVDGNIVDGVRRKAGELDK